MEQQEELLFINKRGNICVKDTKANTKAVLEISQNSEKKRKLKYIEDKSKDMMVKRSKKDRKSRN